MYFSSQKIRFYRWQRYAKRDTLGTQTFPKPIYVDIMHLPVVPFISVIAMSSLGQIRGHRKETVFTVFWGSCSRLVLIA